MATVALAMVEVQTPAVPATVALTETVPPAAGVVHGADWPVVPVHVAPPLMVAPPAAVTDMLPVATVIRPLSARAPPVIVKVSFISGKVKVPPPVSWHLVLVESGSMNLATVVVSLVPDTGGFSSPPTMV